MNTAQWRVRVSDAEAYRRANGPKRWNAVRKVVAACRREEVRLLLEAWGFHYGVQARIAAALHVHPSAVSRDLQALAPLVESCPACGACVPRRRTIR